MRNAPGFYRVPWTKDGLGFEQCPVPEACPSVQVDIEQPGMITTQAVFTPGSKQCLIGHIGPLCTKCNVGYARLGGRICEPCASDGENYSLLVFMLLLVTLAVLWVVRGQIITRGLGKKQHSVIKKVFLNHLQQVSLMLAFNLKWPNPLKFTLSLTDSASSAGAEVASPECVRTDEVPNAVSSAFRMRVVAAVVTPFGIMAIACALVWALWLRKRAKSTVNELRRQLTVAVFVVAFVFYTPITRTTMQLFACQDIGGQLRLTADPDVLCNGAGNNGWRFGLGLPLLLVYVMGLPVTVGLLLWQRREQLDLTAVRRSLGFFYTGYKREYYWYELFVMGRKAAFAMTLVALSPLGLLWQIGVGSLVVMSGLAVSAWLKPFTQPIFNMIDTGSMLLSLMTLSGGAVLLQYDSAWRGGETAGGAAAGGEAAQQAVTVVLTVLNFVFIVGMVGWWLHSYLTKELAPRVQKRMRKLHGKGKGHIKGKGKVLKGAEAAKGDGISAFAGTNPLAADAKGAVGGKTASTPAGTRVLAPALSGLAAMRRPVGRASAAWAKGMHALDKLPGDPTVADCAVSAEHDKVTWAGNPLRKASRQSRDKT